MHERKIQTHDAIQERLCRCIIKYGLEAMPDFPQSFYNRRGVARLKLCCVVRNLNNVTVYAAPSETCYSHPRIIIARVNHFAHVE